jgi:hypothetical protein
MEQIIDDRHPKATRGVTNGFYSAEVIMAVAINQWPSHSVTHGHYANITQHLIVFINEEIVLSGLYLINPFTLIVVTSGTLKPCQKEAIEHTNTPLQTDLICFP